MIKVLLVAAAIIMLFPAACQAPDHWSTNWRSLWTQEESQRFLIQPGNPGTQEHLLRELGIIK